MTNSKEYHQRYYLEHKEQWKGYRQDEEERRVCGRNYYQKHREEVRERQRKYSQRRSKEIKIEVLTHYGKGELACVKCGYSDTKALSLDHIDNTGAKERKQCRTTGWQFYLKLKNNGYPKGYQTLCMNCQWVKREE